MKYKLFLRGGARTLEIPVLPEKLPVESDGDNETAKVLQLGEINQLNGKKLRAVEWEALFPAHPAPYVNASNLLAPIEYVRAIQSWRDAEEPVQFIAVGTDLDINGKMSIESFSYEERGGEPGDLYYSIELLEYKDYAPRRISITAGGAAVILAPVRAGTQALPPGSHYTTRPGDTLWSIAQQIYGDGGQYEKLYTANKAQIDSRNNTTGNTRFTIYTGQVLYIP